jgi:hypothetical protein
MKYFPFLSMLILAALLMSACQTDHTALGRVQSVLDAYRSADGAAFEGQLTVSLRRLGVQCPDGLQYGCLQLVYRNFALEQHRAVQAPQSVSLFLYEKQTDPSVRMVLAEGNWGGSPAVISCQVFFVMTDGSTWLVDNFDAPEAMTCRQRSDELTRNLFGSSLTPTPTQP